MLLKPQREEPNEVGAAYEVPNSGRLRFLSPVVLSAQRYLRSAMSKKLSPYQSRYETQISGLYDQIMNRPAFSYDASRDPLFQQYRNQYIREGQRAMQDSIGASAALTGGYGNSWAATAGYQAYGEYLKALNDQLPELQKQAREEYDAEGKALTDKANLTLNLDNREYGWYRDAMNDWQFDAKLALEQRKFDFQVKKYQDALLASAGVQSIPMMEEDAARLQQQILERKKQTGR